MTAALPAYRPQVQPSRLPPADVEGLYVHVPFCFHKCHYCDFYSITHQPQERMERFVDLVLGEAEQWSQQPARHSMRPRTIFIGGGTPTLLPAAAMQRLLRGLRDLLDLSRLEEWTIEANPATVVAEYAAMMRGLGVDRLSLGAQSFDRDELRVLERHHDPEDVPQSIDIARGAGFARLNVDLIYAIPGQSVESWSRSLDAALALGVGHLSCYGLTYEPNTPIAVRRRLGHLEPVSDEVELEMMHLARRRLRAAGLPPYEISNYAVPGQVCRHNLVYWTGGNYIGLGPSAASHLEGHRWRNRPHLAEWESALSDHRLPAFDYEHLLPAQRAGELAMLRLRLEQGLDFADFAGRTGFDARRLFADPIDRLGRAGVLEADSQRLWLTERGLGVADAVAAEFLTAAAAATAGYRPHTHS